MEHRQIVLQGHLVEYELYYKAIRSLYLKVEKGQLIVRAPLSLSYQDIEKYIIKYQTKILKQIKVYEPYMLLCDGGYVEIFQQRYQIVLRDIQEKRCAIHQDKLYVYDSHIKQCVESFLKAKLKDYLEERIIGYLMHDFDLDMPKIIIKTYKRRWGSCFYESHTISFHLGLIHLEKDLIDYVIVHELTHFLQPNHSPLFYQELAKVMPDYQRRQKLFKEKHT